MPAALREAAREHAHRLLRDGPGRVVPQREVVEVEEDDVLSHLRTVAPSQSVL